MTPMLWMVAILVVIGVVLLKAPQILAFVDHIKRTGLPKLPEGPAPSPAPSPVPDCFEERVRRLLVVRDLIVTLEEVGAKNAASKLRGAITIMIDDDFLAPKNRG